MPARLRSAAVLPALLFCAGLFLAAQDIKIPPAPVRWATDEAGFLSPDTVALLDARLEAYEKATGHQILVYVGRTTGGVAIEEWAVKAFEAWKVGRKGLDDGLVLFIMAGDRKVKIEVGYGLEERVPDASAFRIINEVLVPGFRSGQQDAAVSEAVAGLLSLVSGREEAEPATRRHVPGGSGQVHPEFDLCGRGRHFFPHPPDHPSVPGSVASFQLFFRGPRGAAAEAAALAAAGGARAAAARPGRGEGGSP